MASIRKLRRRRWNNFHDTVGRIGPDLRALEARPLAGETPGAFFGRTAAAVQELLAELAGKGASLQALGGGWSFSELLAGQGVLLETKGAEAVFPVSPAMLASPGGGPHVLVAGGTRIATLNKALKAAGLSLRTSGAHDGQTVAGAMATSVHGSAIGFGAFQNQVRGIHLLTGPGADDSLWLEAGPGPLLKPGTAGSFAARPCLCPQLFAAAQVHLGGLGFVNAVLLEVARRFDLAMVVREPVLSVRHLQLLQGGGFQAFAEDIWPEAATFQPGRTPAYVEVIWNPFSERTPVSVLMPRPRPSVVYLGYAVTPSPAETKLAGGASPFLDTLDRMWRQAESVADLLIRPWMLAEAVMLQQLESPPKGEAPVGRSWGEVFGPPGWRPVDLYSAAFAVPRQELARTIEVLEGALFARGDDEAGPLVFTLRFVTEAECHLAFQRFAETCVVNVDGLDCDRSRQAAARMTAALEARNIPFSQHWGKLGDIIAARVAREFGGQGANPSALGQWQSARARLLRAPGMPNLFRNDALRLWGLI